MGRAARHSRDDLPDAAGLKAGDAVLKGIAREAARIADAQASALARIAGDEFILLLPAGCEGQRRIAEALLDRCRTGTSSLQNCTLSMGFAQVEAAEENFEAALSRADEALYRAKADGRGRLAA
ncbi:diguanylate cyclase domain-containing protein [Sphingobium sp. AP50]|uniref:diguanylate cyclase domain-containing protein n=1 Tax=Sphingobium sp. AP50 TaxID=1884369 RepID=UPI000B80E9AB|nr:diguanylate cyclase [Sphingobium sp. AP50]